MAKKPILIDDFRHEVLPLGHDFAKGKYRKYLYQHERYVKIAKELAEARGPRCLWCGVRQIKGRKVNEIGYHTKCLAQKERVDRYMANQQLAAKGNKSR